MPRKRPAPRTPSVRETEPELVYDPTKPPTAVVPETATGNPVDTTPRHIAYTSRIEVIEAFQYAGSLRDAPDFIDRNWAGWDATPILRVPHPAHPDGPPAICHPGDYVVRQSVTLAPNVPAEERLEVWPKADFERLFIPKRVNGTDNAPRVKAPSPDITRSMLPPSAVPPSAVPSSALPLIQSMPDVDLEELFHDTRTGHARVEGTAEDTGKA